MSFIPRMMARRSAFRQNIKRFCFRESVASLYVFSDMGVLPSARLPSGEVISQFLQHDYLAR